MPTVITGEILPNEEMSGVSLQLSPHNLPGLLEPEGNLVFELHPRGASQEAAGTAHPLAWSAVCKCRSREHSHLLVRPITPTH